jgi:hypothetical protein
MARHVVERTICDMHADEDVEATTGRDVTVNGTQTHLDLCDQDAQKFDTEMNAWVNAGQRMRSPRAATGRPSRSKDDRDKPQTIRDWARKNGFEVSDRGRVPGPVIEAYRAAN